MKVAEQIKDSYGNLINLYGVYEITITKQTDKNLAYPKKRETRKLISTYPTLVMARESIELKTNKKRISPYI